MMNDSSVWTKGIGMVLIDVGSWRGYSKRLTRSNMFLRKIHHNVKNKNVAVDVVLVAAAFLLFGPRTIQFQIKAYGQEFKKVNRK